ncbi:MAG: molybdopterin-dependent oxidoreductase [Clostridiales bacterium]|nr:molybdopterin-dependent oxidoreductase [Clostridiales bacterium]
MALVTGKPVFMDDLAPKDCLIVKLLRSPHAFAYVEEIDTATARKVPGIEAIFTWQDVPNNRFTNAGQTYPEPSPYDRLILDRVVRYVGDPVAIVAGKDEKSVMKALKLIKVTYRVMEPVLDFKKAKDAEILVHPEEDWKALCPVGADRLRNLVASGEEQSGDLEEAFGHCDVILERTYHTKANQQAMMETFRTCCFMDSYGRLNILSSTQIVFHVRRIVATALGISKSKIRVTKPRIGGGFGAKQTAVSEVYPAFVTWMTKKPSKLIFTREESQIASSPRHEMEIKVRVGASRDGIIRAIDMYTLSNSGAYSEHGPTTVGLSGHKAISLYGKTEAFRFCYDVVYTNKMASGAYRGYGATQGFFALESAVNELAEKLSMDPTKIRELNMVREGQKMPAYYGEQNSSCALDRCLKRAKEMIDWENKYPARDMGNGKVRGVGVAMCMQGSGISGVDVGSATVRVNEDGIYTLMIGSADMGTGCDTILAQMVAECMECNVEDVVVMEADTDASPYDSGSYASSTTYITGQAVVKACDQLREEIEKAGRALLGLEAEDVVFDGKQVLCETTGKSVALREIVTWTMAGHGGFLQATKSHTSPVSPPPFMVGMAEVEVDKETGQIDLIDYAAVVDCGTPVNINLARVQAEGGIVQGIGMALYEDVQYDNSGVMLNNSLMQYKIPARADLCPIRVEFEPSFEPSGPFGAKSIGEVVINTPSPAIAAAVRQAAGVWIRDLPITPEKIVMEPQTYED